MLSMIGLRALSLMAVLLIAGPAFAGAEEAELPAVVAYPALWPWLIAAVVALAIGGTAIQTFKKGSTVKRKVDSFEAWTKTENELTPRSHTSARLPGRDIDAAPRRRAAPAAGKPDVAAAAFGRRSA